MTVGAMSLTFRPSISGDAAALNATVSWLPSNEALSIVTLMASEYLIPSAV